jgi:hypothetical protein
MCSAYAALSAMMNSDAFAGWATAATWSTMNHDAGGSSRISTRFWRPMRLASRARRISSVMAGSISISARA